MQSSSSSSSPITSSPPPMMVASLSTTIASVVVMAVVASISFASAVVVSKGFSCGSVDFVVVALVDVALATVVASCWMLASVGNTGESGPSMAVESVVAEFDGSPGNRNFQLSNSLNLL